MSNPTLGGGEQPASVMDHIIEVLHFGQHVVTGSSPGRQRDWILGNRYIFRDETAFTGQIGWQRDDRQQASRYESETQEWLDEEEPAERGAHAPFVFDGNSRILGVLKHSTFSETTVASVFQILLREGEQQREWPSTEWSVEPILDERDFLSWLHSVQSVTSINLVAELPNPDGLEEFGPIWQEMQDRGARLISTKMVAANDAVGLQGLEEDSRVMGNLAMGRQGFGHVEARGRRGGQETIYDQREKVAREVIDDLGQTWEQAERTMLNRVRRVSASVLRRGNGRQSGQDG
jgi:hypothetical protein